MATPSDLGLSPTMGGEISVDGVSFRAVNGQWVPASNGSGSLVRDAINSGIIDPNSTVGTYSREAILASGGGGVLPFGPAPEGNTPVLATVTDPFSGTLFRNVQTGMMQNDGSIINVNVDATQFGVDPAAAAEIARRLGGTLVDVPSGGGPTAAPRQLAVQIGGTLMNAGLLIQRYATYGAAAADIYTRDELARNGDAGSFRGLQGNLSFIPQPGQVATTVPPNTMASQVETRAGSLPPGTVPMRITETSLPIVNRAENNTGSQILGLARANFGQNPLLTVWEWNYYREQVTGSVGFDPVEMGLTTDRRYDFNTWWAANLRMEARTPIMQGGPSGGGPNTGTLTPTEDGSGGSVGVKPVAPPPPGYGRGSGQRPPTTQGPPNGGGVALPPVDSNGRPVGGAVVTTDGGWGSLFWNTLKTDGPGFIIEAIVKGSKAYAQPGW